MLGETIDVLLEHLHPDEHRAVLARIPRITAEQAERIAIRLTEAQLRWHDQAEAHPLQAFRRRARVPPEVHRVAMALTTATTRADLQTGRVAGATLDHVWYVDPPPPRRAPVPRTLVAALALAGL